LWFQSHNDAIAAAEPVQLALCQEEFQSHNDAIAACAYGHCGLSACQRFNPTMMRLLQQIIALISKALNAFQSHNDAIAADNLRANPVEIAIVSIPQ